MPSHVITGSEMRSSWKRLAQSDVKAVAKSAYRYLQSIVASDFSASGNRLIRNPWDFPEAILCNLLQGNDRRSLDIVIIGAHHGNELNRLAKCGALDKFFCFEPSPANQKALIKNLEKYLPAKSLIRLSSS
jgi:hypothetical protein